MRNKSTRKVVRAGLVLNNTSAAAELTTNQLQHLTWNLSTKLVRNDTMEGKSYTVVPMVMIVEGVHEGSNGPLYYPAEELARNPEVWNCKPVVVYHPSRDGKGISACEPAVLSKHKIGVIMNTKFDKLGRLTAEAWLEEDRVKKVDERVWNAIEAHEPLELSTGLFTDNEMTEGEWQGEKYIAIARNHRPDHLAVLPDIQGACSLKDGAGFIRNQITASFPNLDAEDVELLRDRVITVLSKAKDSKKGAVAKLLTNEASYEQAKDMLYMVLQKKYPADKGFACPWIEAVYDNSFVYCMGGKLFKLGYSKSDTSVKLVGEPSEVVRVTEYRTAPTINAAPASQPTNNKRGNTMNKEQIVADLIANHGHSEDDRAVLMGLDEAVLAKMQKASVVTANKAKTSAEKPTTNAEKTEKVEKPAAPTAATVLNASELAALSYGQRRLAEDRAKLTTTITANKSNRFTAEQLASMPIEHLESLAHLAASSQPVTTPPASDFSGLGGHAPLTNTAANAEDAALVYTGLDFAKK